MPKRAIARGVAFRAFRRCHEVSEMLTGARDAGTSIVFSIIWIAKTQLLFCRADYEAADARFALKCARKYRPVCERVSRAI